MITIIVITSADILKEMNHTYADTVKMHADRLGEHLYQEGR